MNTHKNARLTYLRRLEMVQDILEGGLPASEAAAKQGVSAVTARKWLGRYLADGAAGLLDKSSRPEKSPRAIAPHVALAIVELRRKLLLQAHIASYMGVSKATVSRVLRRAGLSRLSDLRADEPVQRYERENPGELLHIDIKNWGDSTRSGIASLATAASARGTSVGTTSSWLLTTTAGQLSPPCTQMRVGTVPQRSCAQP
jgi:transposase